MHACMHVCMSFRTLSKTLHLCRNRVQLMRVGSCALAHRNSGLYRLKLNIKGEGLQIKLKRMAKSHDKKNKIVDIHGDAHLSFTIK